MGQRRGWELRRLAAQLSLVAELELRDAQLDPDPERLKFARAAQRGTEVLLRELLLALASRPRP